MSYGPPKVMKKTSVRQPPSIQPPPSPICHPERTRISYLTALTAATYVVLSKENHMQSIEATTLDRKSGEAEGSAVPRTLRGNAGSHPATVAISRLQIVFQTPHKTVILRGCDFFDFLVHGPHNRNVFQNSHKTVILSEAPRGSIA
jgi:hypothetical protein